MKKLLLLVVALFACVYSFAGERIGSPNVDELLSSASTEAITNMMEKILGENWLESDSRVSYFSLEASKEVIFSAAVEAGILLGAIPMVSDYEGGVIVLTTSPNQALSGSVFYTLHIEEVTFGEVSQSFVTMRTKYLYFSKYSGWNTDSSSGSIFHKLFAVTFSLLFQVKKFSYELSEAVINNPEETLKRLEDFLKNTETEENGTKNESSP
ncbi:MAG TPA: hypothetical protein DHV12_01690 [Thermotogae bacterium]|nr:hypothetical protein [Thermotogota bacterium]